MKIRSALLRGKDQKIDQVTFLHNDSNGLRIFNKGFMPSSGELCMPVGRRAAKISARIHNTGYHACFVLVSILLADRGRSGWEARMTCPAGSPSYRLTAAKPRHLYP